jgi:hypothetical protein
MPIKAVTLNLVLLIFIAGGFVALIDTLPAEAHSFVGSFLVAVGCLQIFLHRRFGSRSFIYAQSLPRKISSLWNTLGEKGAKQLYLGIGCLTLIAGAILIGHGPHNGLGVASRPADTSEDDVYTQAAAMEVQAALKQTAPMSWDAAALAVPNATVAEAIHVAVAGAVYGQAHVEQQA